MTRRNWLLVGVVAAELVAGGFLLFRQRSYPVPPVPDLADADPALAARIRDLAGECRTPDVWAALGEVYLAHGYFPAAEACYREAAAADPGRADRAYEWGFALERIGLLAAANRAYERAVALGHPEPGGCWYSVGRNHLRAEDVAAARAAFEKAGDQPSARYELARLLVRAGKEAEAIPILDTLAREYPDAVQPPLLRHKIELLADRPAAAAYGELSMRSRGRLPTPFDRDWERLEAAHDRVGLAHEVKEAQRLLADRKWADAESRLRATVRGAWDPSAADLFAEVAFQKGQPAEAAGFLREVVDRSGPSAHLLTRLGDAYAADHRPALAIAAWERATGLGVGGEVKNAYYRLGTHAERSRDIQASRRYYAWSLVSAGHELFWSGDLRKARGAFGEALKLAPGVAMPWFYIGEIDRLSGLPEAAREAYRKCLGVDPDFGRAVTGLSLLPPPPK